ncbi:GNAT family N-acetyltransferase [Microbacterium sp. BWT-B31]|uniref:GNAT family N-acetyltransferase n=1 Tax=Microbacterium sp. BWT-B31 TaxID=3232072 RepID=UPI003527B89D
MVQIQATRPDAPDAHALLRDYFALRASIFPGGGYRTVFPDPEAFEAPAGVFVVVRDDDGTAVGCGGIRHLPDGPAGVRYEVKHVYLAESTRGRGWGRLLLDDLERRARELGAAELVLDTHHTLEAAGGLYASSGYRSVEPYNDNPNATRWYAKSLTER